ncbi:HAD family hydrolase [Nocardiopsis ansamitocini]|uniref:Hydrolase n=1 Tax=Nocardiopsis ansamitocini TaxID=1670832 RepID=A0A9W6P9M9_9ACTN|nr:HAD-IA family hydrolase [Nocardiopsis ansamitocini]GLU49528.1 hydrolase [Nocardiopsis ansamitocini]
MKVFDSNGNGVPLGQILAVIFDVDGVVTDTASVHAAAWKRTFDEFLLDRSRSGLGPFRPFDLRQDYRRFVDGMGRSDGVRTFLASRDITLPEGDEPNRPEALTVSSLGDRKDHYFLDYIRRYGVAAFPSTVAFVHELRDRGLRTAAVSASRNCKAVLRAAGVTALFDVRVDGIDAARWSLPGKPDPALFQEAARRLAVAPSRAAVVEDSLAGVEAARRGGFGFTVGVDRAGQHDGLIDRGADVVVADLGELALSEKKAVPWITGA